MSHSPSLLVLSSSQSRCCRNPIFREDKQILPYMCMGEGVLSPSDRQTSSPPNKPIFGATPTHTRHRFLGLKSYLLPLNPAVSHPSMNSTLHFGIEVCSRRIISHRLGPSHSIPNSAASSTEKFREFRNFGNNKGTFSGSTLSFFHRNTSWIGVNLIYKGLSYQYICG